MQSRRKSQNPHNDPVNAPAQATAPGELNETRTETPTPEQEKIAAWLKSVRFRKKLLGGVDEADVWKKLSELNSLYEAALTAERNRCDAMVDYYQKTCFTAVQKYKQAAASASARRKRTGDE